MPHLIKLIVCSHCCSPYIIIADCICTYNDDYPRIELEFDQCECCDNINRYPSYTEFNSEQFKKLFQDESTKGI